jgi:hypothetical protein
MQVQPPNYTLPDVGALSKAAGNNWNDPAFKALHNKKQLLHVTANTCLEAPAAEYTPVCIRDPEDPPAASHHAPAFAATQLKPGSADGTVARPAKWLTLDDKVLVFAAYFIDGSVRRVSISYYLADNTVVVIESRMPNSGFQGGKLLKRHNIPGVTLQRLNVGESIEMYGRLYHIVDADAGTRELLYGLGVEVPESLPYPDDSDSSATHRFGSRSERRSRTWADRDLKLTFELAAKGRVVTHNADEIRRTQQFLADDGKVLAFQAVWDDRGSAHGELRRFELRYYLSDSTVEVLERLGVNAGRDPSRAFTSRRHLPRQKHLQVDGGVVMRGNAMLPEEEYYQPGDFDIGAIVNLYGRQLRLVGCDAYTRYWYRTTMGIELAPEIDVHDFYAVPPRPQYRKPPPPHNGFGTEEDSLGNCNSLVLKPPRPNPKQYAFEGVELRFTMRFHNAPSAEDRTRKFVLTVYPSDDTLQIGEVAIRNSGQIAGRFLRRQKVKKFKGEGAHTYYNWQDFNQGGIVNINGYFFLIESMDAASRLFLTEHGVDVPPPGPAQPNHRQAFTIGVSLKSTANPDA